MPTFALNEIPGLRGRLKVFKLKIDEDCEFDNFVNMIREERTYEKELNTIQTTISIMAECKTLPEKKFKDITPRNEPVKEFEIRTRNLRVYLFHDKGNGRVVILGGKKTTQDADIAHFRNLKKSYCQNQNE